MYNVSQLFRDLCDSNNREFEMKLVVNDELEIDDSKIFDLEIENSIIAGETYSIGNCIASKLTIEVLEVEDIPLKAKVIPHLRIKDNTQTSEWLQLGVFFVEEKSKTQNRFIYNCYDSIIKLDEKYQSQLELPTTINAIIDEISATTGVIINKSNIVNYNIFQHINGSYRDALSEIAAINAGNFIADNQGVLKLLKLSMTNSKTITPSEYISLETKNQQANYTKLILEKDNLEYVRGTGEDEFFMKGYEYFTNNIESIIDNVYNEIIQINYEPLSISLKPYPYLELGDRINVVENKTDREIFTNIMRIKYKYSGGLNMIIESKFNRSDKKMNKNISNTIERLSNEINLRVSKDDLVSEINQRADQIEFKFSTGNNIIINSGFEYDLNNWYMTGNTSVDIIKDTNNYQGNTAKIIGSEQWSGIYQPFNVTVGKKYTVSFVAKMDSGFNNGDTLIGINGVQTVNVRNNFEYQKYTFTITATQSSYEFIAYVTNATDWTSFYLDNIKVEEGEYATDWSENPRDIQTAYTRIDGSGITIREGGLFLEDENGEQRGSFQKRVDGTVLEVDNIAVNNIVANNVWEVYQGASTLYVDNAYTGDSDGSQSKPFSTIQSAIDYIGKILPYPVTINVASGIYEEDIKIQYMQGAPLTLNLDTGSPVLRVIIQGSIWVEHCRNVVIVYGYYQSKTMSYDNNQDNIADGTVSINYPYTRVGTTKNRRPLYVNTSSYVYVKGVGFDAGGFADTPVAVNQSKLKLEYCFGVGGTSTSSIYINNLNQVFLTNFYGDKAAVVRDCSVVAVTGAYTQKGLVEESLTNFINQSTKSNAIMLNNTSEPPTTKTISINAIKTASCRSSWRTDNSRVYQGEWDDNGNHIGLILYNASDIDTLNGKTISKATLTIKRYSAGGEYSSLANGLKLHYHKLSSIGSGTTVPTTSNITFVKDINRPALSETLTVDITNEVKNIINKGSANFRGFAFYTSNTSNTYYCILEDLAHCNYMLNVTYS